MNCRSLQFKVAVERIIDSPRVVYTSFFVVLLSRLRGIFWKCLTCLKFWLLWSIEVWWLVLACQTLAWYSWTSSFYISRWRMHYHFSFFKM